MSDVHQCLYRPFFEAFPRLNCGAHGGGFSRCILRKRDNSKSSPIMMLFSLLLMKESLHEEESVLKSRSHESPVAVPNYAGAARPLKCGETSRVSPSSQAWQPCKERGDPMTVPLHSTSILLAGTLMDIGLGNACPSRTKQTRFQTRIVKLPLHKGGIPYCISYISLLVYFSDSPAS